MHGPPMDPDCRDSSLPVPPQFAAFTEGASALTLTLFARGGFFRALLAKAQSTCRSGDRAFACIWDRVCSSPCTGKARNFSEVMVSSEARVGVIRTFELSV